MFLYILELIGEYHRTHGRRPEIVYLNARHMREFMEECPDLFDKETAIPLGFRIVIVPESELAQPKAAWLPRRPKTPPVQTEKGPELIAWTAGAHGRTKR